jgi:hypothetical protein
MLPHLDTHEGRQEAIRRFVKPISEAFQPQLRTFHFFFEPNGLLLRLEAEDTIVSETIKPYIEKRLTEMAASNQSVRVDPGYTEQQDYGQGWELALRIFELGSRSAILAAENSAGTTRLGSQFNEGKFVHLILNQWGYAISEEAVFHFNSVIERLAVIFSSGNMEVVARRVPQFLGEMQQTFLQQMTDIVKRKMSEASNPP